MASQTPETSSAANSGVDLSFVASIVAWLEGRGEAMTAALPGVHMEKQAVGQVRLSVNAEDLHLFDPKTGQRLN